MQYLRPGRNRSHLPLGFPWLPICLPPFGCRSQNLVAAVRFRVACIRSWLEWIPLLTVSNLVLTCASAFTHLHNSERAAAETGMEPFVPYSNENCQTPLFLSDLTESIGAFTLLYPRLRSSYRTNMSGIRHLALELFLPPMPRPQSVQRL